MSPTFRPMSDLNQRQGRLPDQGRIRLGQQVPTNSGKTRPTALHTFRFTSPSRSAIEAIAELYGGDIAAWNNEWEVVSKAAEIPVVLPPDPLGDGTSYELWDRGGLKRRCDGVTMVCPRRVSDSEVDMIESPCGCNEAQVRSCSEKTRLSVILPDVPFGGVWRLDTGSYHASLELPGMISAIQAFAGRGFVRAFLGVRTEEKMEEGRKKRYIVPFLRADASVTEALTGAAGLAGIAVAPPMRELEVYKDTQIGVAEATIVQPEGIPTRSTGAVSTTGEPCVGRAAGAPLTGPCQGDPIQDPAREQHHPGSHGPGVPPDLDTYSVAEAKSRLLAVVNGDKNEARRAWDGFGFAGHDTIPVAEFTAASLAYVAAKYHQQPDDIVDAEVVDDDGRAF